MGLPMLPFFALEGRWSDLHRMDGLCLCVVTMSGRRPLHWFVPPYPVLTLEVMDPACLAMSPTAAGVALDTLPRQQGERPSPRS